MSSSIHQPQLSTIEMVEQKLKKKKYFRSRNQLFLSLGKRVMYPTITTILDYLEESKKISFKKKMIQLIGFLKILVEKRNHDCYVRW